MLHRLNGNLIDSIIQKTFNLRSQHHLGVRHIHSYDTIYFIVTLNAEEPELLHLGIN